MVTWFDVRDAVDARYEALGPLAWDSPHGGDGPLLEAYERTSDFRRFEAPPLRVRAWVDVLVGLGVASAVEVGCVQQGGKRLRRELVRAKRSGTLALWVTTGVQEPTTLAVAHPQLVIESEPRCGCDGCDFGSDSLLGLFDCAFESVVTGYVTVRQDEQDRYVYLSQCSSQGGAHFLDHPLVGEWHGAAWVD
ncbi:Uncharacterised protein [Dermatophilus congolensis]|uniref:Uncharacterized protein n=1 Tax=Dermatophilus congolensis TaxID=1863 RepID=A0A239VIC0_9MICO|nr:DUF6226 family protein [Dermatophilus congolensis]SNV21428.1 Uncharacterised protein [Dermatophilus congolensis]